MPEPKPAADSTPRKPVDFAKAPADSPTPAPGISPDDVLPPIQPPSMTLVIQLFLVPLLIVGLIVVIWLGVQWLVTVSSNPQKYVDDLQSPGKGSWQSAASLADMLRDPRNEHLKRDAALANKLAETLDTQINQGEMSDHAIKLRMFLCRALGEFYITTGLPVLTKAVNTERDPREVDVRRTAIEAIAVLADNTDPATAAKQPGLMRALVKASGERGSAGAADEEMRGKLRARAAFALGVIGNQEALDRLAMMCSDGYPDARYNAATGLSRHGDPRGERVLVQMLDPENDAVVAGEDEETAIVWKRALVMTTGLNAAELLAQRNTDADLADLEDAVSALVDAKINQDIQNSIRTRAREVEIRLQQRK